MFLWLSLLLVKLWTFRSVSEAATAGILLEKVFLGLRPATLFKKRLRHRCFSVNFVKFLRTPFSQNTSEGLFLVYLELYQNMTDGKFCENRFSIFPDLSIIDISQVPTCTSDTAWKVSKYGVISGPYFRVFRLSIRIKYGDLRSKSLYSIRIQENTDQKQSLV